MMLKVGAYCTKPVLCNSSLMHKTLPFYSLSCYQNRGKYVTCSVDIYITPIQRRFDMSAQE